MKENEKDGRGGARKGAGRPSKAKERGLAKALDTGFRRVLRTLPKEVQEKFKDENAEKDTVYGSEAVIQTMWEIGLGIHSYEGEANADMAAADLRKRFEAMKEIQKLYYGPSPEGVVGTTQNKFEIADIAALVSFTELTKEPNEETKDNSDEGVRTDINIEQ